MLNVIRLLIALAIMICTLLPSILLHFDFSLTQCVMPVFAGIALAVVFILTFVYQLLA